MLAQLLTIIVRELLRSPKKKRISSELPRALGKTSTNKYPKTMVKIVNAEEVPWAKICDECKKPILKTYKVAITETQESGFRRNGPVKHLCLICHFKREFQIS